VPENPDADSRTYDMMPVTVTAYYLL